MSISMTRGMIGKKHTPETKARMRLAHLGPKNHRWVGDDVQYRGIHNWMERNFERPKLCENCYIKPARDWANISGEYRRDRIDWRGLCRSCHIREHKVTRI